MLELIGSHADMIVESNFARHCDNFELKERKTIKTNFCRLVDVLHPSLTVNDPHFVFPTQLVIDQFRPVLMNAIGFAG